MCQQAKCRLLIAGNGQVLVTQRVLQKGDSQAR